MNHYYETTETIYYVININLICYTQMEVTTWLQSDWTCLRQGEN